MTYIFIFSSMPADQPKSTKKPFSKLALTPPTPIEMKTFLILLNFSELEISHPWMKETNFETCFHCLHSLLKKVYIYQGNTNA